MAINEAEVLRILGGNTREANLRTKIANMNKSLSDEGFQKRVTAENLTKFKDTLAGFEEFYNKKYSKADALSNDAQYVQPKDTLLTNGETWNFGNSINPPEAASVDNDYSLPRANSQVPNYPDSQPMYDETDTLTIPKVASNPVTGSGGANVGGSVLQGGTMGQSTVVGGGVGNLFGSLVNSFQMANEQAAAKKAAEAARLAARGTATTGLDVTGTNEMFQSIKKPRKGLLGNISAGNTLSNALTQKTTLLGS